MFNTRTKQLLRCPHLTQRPGKMNSQRFFISMSTIGQFSFSVSPNLLYRIKFWSISRESISYNSSISAKKHFYISPSMSLTSIPYQYYYPPLMTHQVFQEIDYIMFFDIVPVHSDIKSKTLSFGRYRKNCNGRNLIPFIAVLMQRCATDRCPCAEDIRDKHESAFVQKVQVGTKSLGFFLYMAISSSSNLQWLLRPSPMPDVPVSDNSSQVRSVTFSRHLPGYTERDNSSRSTEQSASESRVPWDNRTALLLSTTVFLNPPFEYCPTCRVVPKETGSEVLLHHFSGTIVPILQQNLATISQLLIPREMFFQFSVKKWLENVAFPDLLGFHVVSCI